MRISIAFLAVAVLLAACSTPAQRAADMEKEAIAMMVEYGPACDKLGYQRGTDNWRNCIVQLSTKDEISEVNGYYDHPRRFRRW